MAQYHIVSGPYVEDICQAMRTRGSLVEFVLEDGIRVKVEIEGISRGDSTFVHWKVKGKIPYGRDWFQFTANYYLVPAEQNILTSPLLCLVCREPTTIYGECKDCQQAFALTDTKI